MPIKGFKRKIILIATATVILVFQAASASADSPQDTMYGSFYYVEQQEAEQAQQSSAQTPSDKTDAQWSAGETYEIIPGQLDGITIGIDPGHQQYADQTLEPLAPGSDRTKEKMSAGAKGIKTDTPEYEINLAVANKLYLLLKSAGATVVMTRVDNLVMMSNMERALYMNARHVDFWIRIHCNFSIESSNRGASVLTPKSEMAPEKDARSRELASYVLGEFCRTTGEKPLAVDESECQTGFNWSQSPVIAVEMGFLSNATEDVRLCKDSYQNACAAGIFNGIVDYCKNTGEQE